MNYKNLKPDERIIGIVRRYGLTYFWVGLICLLLIVGPFFFIVPLFQRKPWGVIVFAIVLSIGFFWSLRLFITWYYNYFLITSQRVIILKQKGFFERTISEAEYGKIQDVSYQFKGFFQTLFHYGTIRIQTVSSLELNKIHRPERIQDLIATLQTEFQRTQKGKEESRPLTAEEALPRLSSQELVKIVKEAKEKLGKEVFDRMSSNLKI
jgi:uncharacterized membrane protein YdbT with pleckstrin-like domain